MSDGFDAEDERGRGAGGPVPGAGDAVPDFVAAREHVVGSLVWFGRRLRADGAAVPANAARTGAEALAAVGLDDRDRAREALRAALLTDARDADAFEERFPAFWHRLRTGIADSAVDSDREDDVEQRSAGGIEPAPADDGPPAEGAGRGTERGTRRVAGESRGDGADAGEERVATYSAAGGRGGVEDGDGVGGLGEADVRRFERALARLPGRRREPGRGPRLDGRRALRASLATGGAPVELPERATQPAEFRPCVLADVSGSVLDTIDRDLLLALLARLQRDGRDARTFLFDTDLREVSDAFAGAGAGADPAAALRRAEVEWGGGTRIGDALATVRREHPTAVDRRTVAVVVSDGLDVGDLDTLERGMAWLARRAGAVLWLNPLAAGEQYRPTCRGMATALPYVDGLFAFARSADLSEVARQLEQQGLGGEIGYEHDPRRSRP